MIFTDNPPVITGMGVATPIGTRLLSFQNNLERGRSGLRFIERFDCRQIPVKKAFEVVESLDFNDPALDLHINFALHAARAALDDSGILTTDFARAECATIVSSSKGGLGVLEKRLRALTCESGRNQEAGYPSFQEIATDGATSAVHRQFGLSGYTQNAVAACATGLHSIMLGAMAVAVGDADFSVAGAADASLTPLALSAYNQMKLYSHDDMRPFDRRRSGFIIGEGAGVMIIERELDARARGKTHYAKIRGFLMAQDLGGMCHHDPEARVLADAIVRLLKAADLQARDIDYVCLHGTSTLAGDAYEAEQCRLAFGDTVEKILFNAPKSMLGHMLGAAGAVEAIIMALSIRSGAIYPTINSSQAEKRFGLNINFNRLTQKKVQYALKISMGFGGHVGILLLEK